MFTQKKRFIFLELVQINVPKKLIFFRLCYCCNFQLLKFLNFILMFFRHYRCNSLNSIYIFYRCWQRTAWPYQSTPWSTTGCPTPPCRSPTSKTLTTRRVSWPRPPWGTSWDNDPCTRFWASAKASPSTWRPCLTRQPTPGASTSSGLRCEWIGIVCINGRKWPRNLITVLGGGIGRWRESTRCFTPNSSTRFMGLG